MVQKRAEIAAAIRDHQVIVLCGETGSGKTTQLPKICLELGRGVAGVIGHTQPRRIAARAGGGARGVGAVHADRARRRVQDAVHGQDVPRHLREGDDGGILLAETQSDPLLEHYDTLIIDEAHERSLNIDFLLGYLRQLLPKRPELKLIITSATIDPERFAVHFGAPGKPAPIIEVSGRTYPVDVHYLPAGGGRGWGDRSRAVDPGGDRRVERHAPESPGRGGPDSAAAGRLEPAGAPARQARRGRAGVPLG